MTEETIYDKIVRLIKEYEGIEPSEVSEGSTFEDLGIDSLSAVEIIMALEDELGIEIDPEEDIQTVGDLVRFVESKSNAE